MKITVDFDVPDDSKYFFVTLDCIRFIDGKRDYETFEKYTKDVVVNASTNEK